MGEYMANRIIESKYTYEYVIGKRPDLKDSINEVLTRANRQDLITQ